MSSAAFFRRPAVVLILGLCLVGLGVSGLSRLVTGPSSEPKRVSLSHDGGAEASPAFSPDGTRLAFSERQGGQDSPYHIRVRKLGGGPSAALTDGAGSDLGPAWSADGASIAFLRIDADRARYMVVPAGGGEARQVADFPAPDPPPGPQPLVAWSRDGKSLYVVQWEEGAPAAIAVVPAAGGAPRRLTQPPAGSRGDSCPAVSPDGATLAFVRRSDVRAEHDSEGDGGDGSDIFLADISGQNARKITFENASIHGIAWSADGRDVVYAAVRGTGEKIWRVAASGGGPRNAMAVGKYPAFPAVAAAGHHLAYMETPALDAIWRMDLPDSGPAPPARLLLRSEGREQVPSWSPDGKRIANVSSAGGWSEVWVEDADGGNRKQVTHMKAWWLGWPRWSPDGKELLFTVRAAGLSEVDHVASDGHAAPRRVPLPEDSHEVYWSHDGRWIYFQSMGQLWKAHLDGQDRQKLTEDWADDDPKGSLDGKYIYFRRDRTICRVPTAGGAEEEVVKPDRGSRWVAYQPADGGLYLLELDREERVVTVRFYDFTTKKGRELARLPAADPSSISTFSVSPDGRSILYSAVDRTETTLVLTENFR